MSFNYTEQKIKDRAYLKEVQYDWEQDPRKLKVKTGENVFVRPDFRCYHCGRLIANSTRLTVYCCICHKAMSINRDGCQYDYDSFHNFNKLLADRDQLYPIQFEAEKEYLKASKSDFKTGKGIPI